MSKEYFGRGAVEKLGDILAETRARKIFLVRGRGSFEQSGAGRALEAHLAGCDVYAFSDFAPNPRLEDIERGVAHFCAHAPELILAVGGGSALDAAKSVNFLAHQDVPPQAYFQHKPTMHKRGVPLVAIPTTAGTGSEATQFAALYIDKTKQSLDHEYLLPDYAIVDPELTRTLPPQITASCGMDALAQAIESYWSIHSTDESKAYAEAAIPLVMSNLKNAVQNPSPGSREAMARAANLAGKAINITRTTACHAVSYPITAHFGVPHGHAVALTLPAMFFYNSKVTPGDVADARGAAYVKKTMRELAKLVGASDEMGAKASLESLMDDIGLERRLGSLGVDIEVVIKNGFHPDRVKNNPRVLTTEALRGMLGGIL